MKRLAAPAIAAVAVLSVCASTDAFATDYQVSTPAEWAAAVADIHGGSNGTHTITLGADIAISDAATYSSNFVFDNGNQVTLLGNGHKLSLLLNSARIAVNGTGTVLNLGKSDTPSDSLTIAGQGAGEDSWASESLIVLSGSTLNMYDGVTLRDNYSGGGALNGGALRVAANSTFNMYGGAMVDNHITSTAGLGGGAIAVDFPGVTINVLGGVFENNTTSDYGGAIYGDSGASITVKDAVFRNNSAGIGGGALAGFSAGITANNVLFENNGSEGVVDSGSGRVLYGYGGAIMNATGTSLNVTGSTFKSNHAKSGGAIMTYGTNVTISNSLFEGNSANFGGAIRHSSNQLTSTGNTFKKNNAVGYGGAIFTESPLISDGDVITENTANRGGGVYVNASTANLSTTKVFNNKADNHSGDYYVGSNANTVTIANPALMANDTVTFGDRTIGIDGWYADTQSNRYAPTNHTDRVITLEPGNTYSLVAATSVCQLSYDNDGLYRTANATKDFDSNSTVKLNADGGTVDQDEITLTSDYTVENPTKEGRRFLGWSVVAVDGFDYGLKANWGDLFDYEIVEGDEQVFNEGEATDATITTNGDYRRFMKIQYDGEDLAEDKYTATGDADGTTIVFKAGYLNSLKPGDYEFTFVYNDGTVVAKLFIVVKPIPINPDLPDNPPTEDAFGTYVLTLAASIIGLAFIAIRRK